jgi:hypothetical protein
MEVQILLGEMELQILEVVAAVAVVFLPIIKEEMVVLE